MTRCLEGAIPRHQYEGEHGCRVANHGLPRFRSHRFHAAYPFGQVELEDAEVPVRVTVGGFNPLVPGDAEVSGLPVAVLRIQLENPGTLPVDAAVCLSVANILGAERDGKPPQRNNRLEHIRGLTGVELSSDTPPDNEAAGTWAIATTATSGVTSRLGWRNNQWQTGLLDFWDDFSADGRLEERTAESPMASLAVRLRLAPGARRSVTFLLTWHVPNRRTWTPVRDAQGKPTDDPRNELGNHYATRFTSAWDVAQQVAKDLPRLEAVTADFVKTFIASDLPPALISGALNNLSTLRSQTVFRTRDGHIHGWEGCHDREGSCFGTCTHVWNYEQALPFLFPDLSRSMRELAYQDRLDERGMMSFRMSLPRAWGNHFHHGAADGQCGQLVRLWQDFRLSGDGDWLRHLWPGAQRSLEFCWIVGGWDADVDGVMEGCQHNTMDVEYFGPNPQMQLWYLAALRAGEELARAMEDSAFADRCADLYRRGRAWTEANLFNGDFFEQLIQPIPDRERIAPGLTAGMGAKNLSDPDFQLGRGCLIDQLIGDCLARLSGLGPVIAPAQARATNRSLMAHNFKPSLAAHFNHLRTFALGDEPAMLMATWPKGGRPRVPFPYFNEVMTGFEYAAAVEMLLCGQRAAGERVIRAIRSRYDGLRRNPFDEAEWGHHYSRALLSWGAVIAATGFDWDGRTGTMSFARPRKPVTWFWAAGGAWGTVAIRGRQVRVQVMHGLLTIRHLRIGGSEEAFQL